MNSKSGPTLAQLASFDEIIDVRTPSEFALDHIPGAINCPVMDDDERARVGTIFKQESPFLAKKIGAAIVSRNIARHLETRFADKPRNWRPLVYCWRGGKRSGAMTHILQEIGWHAEKLDGGYKNYRKMVIQSLEKLPEQFSFKVVCGKTGSGKSRLLQALASRGAQVLDLEGIAKHRGSILGRMPDEIQPTQKFFESNLCASLLKFDPAKPVYVEAESKRIGTVRLPDALLDAMWAGKCLRLEADFATRIQLLMEDYAHLLAAPELMCQSLDRLATLHGNATIAEWKMMIGEGKWEELAAALIDRHYDAAYLKSTQTHYPRYAASQAWRVSSLAPETFMALADAIASSDA